MFISPKCPFVSRCIAVLLPLLFAVSLQAKDYNIMDYGANNNLKWNITRGIQNAIDRCAVWLYWDVQSRQIRHISILLNKKSINSLVFCEKYTTFAGGNPKT